MHSHPTHPSVASASPPGARPPRSWRLRLRGLVACLAAALVLAGSVVGTVGTAEAASMGPGHGDPNGIGTVGAFVAESDGRQVYCMDSGALSPLNG